MIPFHLRCSLGSVTRLQITSEELNQRARVFESKVYTRAASRQDYLGQIAEGLTAIDSATPASGHTPPPPPGAQVSQPDEPQLQALTESVFNADGRANSPVGAVRVGPGSAGLSSSNPSPGQN